MAIESSQSVGDNREVGMVWMAMNNTSLGLQSLLLDSGVSSHMFFEQECFISYTEANNGQLVTIGGLNHTSVVGYGLFFFQAKLPSGLITLVITILSLSGITLTQIALYVRVDKENLLEFPLICCTLLIHIQLFVLVY